MNTEKVKIQFEASATGLQDIYKQIKQIKDAPNINLDEKLLGQLKDLDNKVPALVKKIKDTMAGDFTIGDIQVLDSEFKQLIRLYESTITSLGKANLPAAIQDQITKATDAVTKAQSELDQINNTIKKKQKKLDSTSSSGLSIKETRDVDKEFVSQFELKDQKFGSFEQYVQAYQKLADAMQLTDEEQVQFLQTAAQVEDAYKRRVTQIQNEIDVEKAKVPAIQKAIADGENYIQNLKEQAASNENLSASEKDVADAILNASQAITQAKTNEKNAIKAATDKVEEDTVTKQENTVAQEKNTTAVAKAAKQVFTYGTILGLFRKIYSTVISTITEMDKALTGMAVVTNMSREQTWELVDSLQNLALQTGKTTTEIASMTTKFLQQGKSISQAIKLTEAAAKAATIAGIDGAQSIDLLTNAMNGFQISANRAMEVSDKFAALAASAATNYEELATALSKVAAQANLAGMSMDFTLGLLTKGIEVTREAPETIGTALKTVIARMRELTDYGATLEDGIDVNRVAKALANIGVELMDTNGQFRDLDSVLKEVGMKWETLNKNQQANVAVALAGTRQQSRLIAMMQDFDRTLELVDISANSYGATLAQSEKYMGGLEAAQNKLTTSMQGLVTSVTNSDIVITVVDALSGLLNIVTDIVSNSWLMIPLLVIVGGHLLRAAETKLSELTYQKQINKFSLQQTKIQKQQRLTLIEARKNQLGILKTKFKITKETNEEYKQSLKDAALDARQNNNLALALHYEQLAAQASISEADKKKEILLIDQEISALTAEENLLKTEIAQTDAQITAQTGLMPGLLGSMVNGLTGFLSILTIIPTLLQLILGLTKAQGKEIDKNTAKEKKGFFASLKNAGAKMAQSAASIPVAGWVIAAAILAAIAGIALAINVKDAADGEKSKDSIAQTREELNQLQADLYNLNSAKQNVSNLGDEFESLSNKIVKTTEDLERMAEVAQQINDTAGRTIVNVNADAETQLQQIRGYNLQQEAQIELKQEDINKKLGQGLTSAKKSASSAFTWAQGATALLSSANIFTSALGAAAVKALEDAKQQAIKDAEAQYYDSLKNDASFVNSIRTVGMANLSGLEGVSSTTSDTVLDMLVDNIDSKQYFSSAGIDTDAFERYISAALSTSDFYGGYTELVAELDKTVKEGSMTAYADMLDKLGTSTDSNFNNLISSLKKSNPMFAAVGQMGTDIARKFDAIGFSSDELNVIWDKLQKSGKAVGKDIGNTFADIVSNLEDIDKDGIVSDLEARQSMYKQLVAEQVSVAQASQNIVNGIDQESDAAKKYKENLILLEQKQEEIKAKQQEITNEQNSSNASQSRVEALQKEMDDLSMEAANLELEIQAVEDAASDCYADLEELKTILGMITAKEITEEFTKLASAMERIANISDIASMSLEEQMELLNDYPELLAAMERGYLTAAEAAKLYGETIASSQDDITANKSNYKLIYGEDSKAQLQVGEMTGFEKLFDDTEEGKDARQRFLDMGVISMDDEWVSKMWGYGLDEKSLTAEQKAIRSKFDTSADFVQYLSSVKADIEEYNKLDYIEGQLAEGNYEVIMSENAKEIWNATTDYRIQRRNALESLNEKLDYADSTQQAKLIQERNDLLIMTIKDGAEELSEIKKETDKILYVDPNDKQYGWLTQYAGEDGSLSEYIEYVNGVPKLKYDLLESLNLTKDESEMFKAYIAGVSEQLGTIAEKEQKINNQMIEDQEMLAQSIVDSEAKILEAQIETLEKRKEAYEEYFDTIDQLNEEEERKATMEDLTRQISALAGGNDSASNSLRKELMSQMEDLRKEEEEARKEAAREQLIQDIDNQIEATNEQLDTVNNSLNKIIALIANPDYTMSIDDNGNIHVLDAEGKNVLPYANGGLVDYTGPAMVHGSPSAPEAFLSAQDTKNMQLLFAALNETLTKSTTINASGEANNTNSIVVENINITTRELNNNQDFKTAGQIFAEEFGKAIKQRGLNINVRK